MSTGYSSLALFRALALTAVKVLAQLVATSVLRVAWLVFPKPMYHVGGMTPARMTAILRGSAKLSTNERVVSMEWAKLAGGTIGLVQRVTLTYSPPNPPNAPKSVIVKAFGTKTADFAIGTIFPLGLNEHKTYSTFAHDPTIAPWMPEIYATHCNAWLGGMLVVVMQDLGHLRFKSSITSTATLDEATRVMRALGSIHGRSWEDAALKHDFLYPPVRFLDESFPRMASKLIDSGRLEGLPRFTAQLTAIKEFDLFNALQKEFRGHCVGATGAACTLPSPSVLTHGDARLENMFWDDERNTVKLVDWQVPMPRTPMEELVGFMHEIDPTIATDPAAMRGLFQVYCDALAASPLGRCPVTVEALVAAIPRTLQYHVLRWTYAITAVMDQTEQAGQVDLVLYARRSDALLKAYLP